MAETPQYRLDLGYDASAGLHTAELIIDNGFPEDLLGEYIFREWTYGEKLSVELEAERVRLNKLSVLQAVKEPDEETQKKIEALENRMDTETYVILQTITTVKKSPMKLEGIEQFKALPGRFGTLLVNIASYLNLTPTSEKKG